ELVRLEGGGGALRWRLPVGEPLADPTVTRTQLFVSTRGGKILAVDPTSGASPRHAVLPQELRTPAAVHPRANCLYQAGMHSNLYVLSTEDLSCQEVLYLGHGAGMVRVPPVMAGNAI